MNQDSGPGSSAAGSSGSGPSGGAGARDRVEAVEFTCGECGATNRLSRQKILSLKASPLCGKCEKPLLRAFERPFADLDPDSYIHPLDRETLEALKRIPGV